MPIKQFPPPTFLPDADWQKKGSDLMPLWIAASDDLYRDAYQGGVDVSYLVLKYRQGIYELWLYADDCDDDETSGLYLPLKRERLWSGQNPMVEELEVITRCYSDRPLKFLFHSEDYNDFNDYGYSQYGE